MNRADFAEKHLLNRSFISYLLYPVSLCYAGLMLFRRKLWQGRGYRAPFKVISVGNLSSGGSGKSPIAIALCKELQKRGLNVAYASRGYKSKLEHTANLVSDGQSLFFPASAAGDEAVMAAGMLPGIPVFSGRKRKEVLELAAKAFPELQVMVLDDAMQHLKVARDLDIVVFDTHSALGNGFVIPAGYLREGLRALSIKSLCVIHQKPGALPNLKLEQALAKTGASLARVQSRAGDILHQGKPIPPQTLKEKGIVLISAIAHPASFEKSVKKLGISYQRHLVFPDHFSFEDPIIRQQLLHDPAKHFLCTAKDAAKLEEFIGERLMVLRMETDIPEALVRRVITSLAIHQ